LGIISKQSLSGTIYSYIGVALGFITTGLILPRLLSTGEVGLLRLLVSYSTLLAQFAVLGFNSVTVKLFPSFRDENNKHHGFLGLALLISLIGFIITIGVYLGFHYFIVSNAKEKSDLFVPYYYYVIPMVFFTLLFGIFDTYYRVLYNAVIGILYKEVVQRLLILAAILLYYFKVVDFHVMVIVYIIAISSPSLFLFFSLLKDKLLFIIPDFNFIDIKLRKEMTSVAFFGIIASYSGVLAVNIDIIMIDILLGLSKAGIYTIAFYFGTLILVPMRSMGKISSVVIADAWKKDDRTTIMDIYRKSSISLSVIGLLLFIGVWGNIDNVFHLVGSAYSSGKYVILFIGLANLTDNLLGVNPHIILNSKHYRWLSYLLLVYAGLLVITNLILIPTYGIVGAALASFISKFLYNGLKYIFLYKTYHFQPFHYKHLFMFIFGFAAWALSTLIPVLDSFVIDLLVRSLFISIAFLLPVYYFNISEDINGKIQQLAKKIFASNT